MGFALRHALHSRAGLGRRYLWLLFLFRAPALVHLLYMYADIAVWVVAQDGVRLEYAKDAPRIGRRYLSHALIPLLFATWRLGPRLRPARWLPVVFLFGVGFPVMSLALLDARAAYVAILGALGRPWSWRRCAGRWGDCLGQPSGRAAAKNCVLTREDAPQEQGQLRRMVDEIAQAHPALRVYDSFDMLCSSGPCAFEDAHALFYTDAHHPSRKGSVRVAAGFLRWLDARPQ